MTCALQSDHDPETGRHHRRVAKDIAGSDYRRMSKGVVRGDGGGLPRDA
jgi:hypothetical protein